MQITPLQDWLPFARPLLISGPCSAESEEQMLETAAQLAEIGLVKIFRAGIWKPRTRPDSFEGIGTKGLVWLREVKEKFGFLTATEVANTQHVKEAIAHQVDILWIGARTVVNPFSVQEIADTIKGIDIPVFVKNPINPDLQLWIGALERINKAGITKIAAVHRGFSSHEHSAYRNIPMWEIPIELMRLYPKLPLLCDPSHIGGNRNLLAPISQQAMDLNIAGLMIESHCNPDMALSDKNQQIVPQRLKEIIENLTIRELSTSNLEFADQLSKLRQAIDEIDNEIIMKLVKRMNISEKIGIYKKENNVTVLQVERWQEILSKNITLGNSMGLSPYFVKKILEYVHKESIKKQTEIMNTKITKK